MDHSFSDAQWSQHVQNEDVVETTLSWMVGNLLPRYNNNRYLSTTRIAPVFTFVADARFPFTASSDHTSVDFIKWYTDTACVKFNISTLYMSPTRIIITP